MKRFILLIAAILCSLSSFALTFEGVEIKGTAQAFSDSLAAHGFNFEGKVERFRIHHGRLMDQDVRIAIESTTNDKIDLIQVIFDFEEYKTIMPIHDYFYEIMEKYFGEPKFTYDVLTASSSEFRQMLEISPNSVILHEWKDKKYAILIQMSDPPKKLTIFYILL